MSHAEVLRTADPDEAVTRLSRVYCPYKLRPSGPAAFFCHHVTRGAGRVRVMDLTFGGEEVVVEPLPFGDFIVVAAPQAGSFSVESDADELTRTTTGALAMDAYRRRRLTWSGDARVTNFVFDRAAFEHTAAELLGFDEPAPVRFAIREPAPHRAHQWRAVGHLLTDHLTRFGGTLDHGLAETQLFRLAVATVLDAFPHTLDTTVAPPAGPAAPRAVRRARDFLELHADTDVRVEDVAAAAGLSVRGLHAAFHRADLPSPMKHLREIRLRRAHEELVAKSPEDTTVTAVALRWGFSNAHRFAALHREHYGTSPGRALAGT
ncbi:AraC family transcriptional regulator [Amycolatopsis sp. NPDC051903]|uniref:AraC family transcriptional regulator n=1 Tax=Amycolatopsis sp. NPDC051903 TaxID=3363936 RepID=UPI0037B378C6